MRAADVLGQLELAGFRVVLNLAGDGVRLLGERAPSPALLALARAHRAQLLEALAPAKEDGGPGGYSKLSKTPPSAAPGIILTVEKNAAAPSSFAGPDRQAAAAAHRARQLGALEALALTPGHCGPLCARWHAPEDGPPHLGECSAGRRAHGWEDGQPRQAVEVRAGHACPVDGGQGFRAKGSGKRFPVQAPAARL